MKKMNVKSWLSLLLVAAMTLSFVLTAEAANKKENIDEISFMMAYWVDQPPKSENNYLFDTFQEKLGIKLNLSLYPNANYVEKAMLKLASGDLPDVMWISDATVKTKAVIDAVEAGAFWDCTDLLESDEYPNLQWAISSTMKANASINGRVYGMPGPRPSARNGILYRADLFEKYNIPVPTDADSVYEAAKLIKENEPDIIPFSYESNIVNLMTVAQGGFNNWGVNDKNELIPAYDTPEYKHSLEILRNMYAEGLMNKDFAIVTGSETQAALNSGKAAMLPATYDSYETYQRSLWEVDPNANLGIIATLGGTTNAQVGSALYMVPKTVSEEKLHRIFKYLNDSLDQEILTWEYFGEEGRNYVLKDGIPEFISAEAQKEVDDTMLVYKSCAVNPVVIHWPSDSGLTKTWKDTTEKYAETCIRDYSSPLLSATQTELGSELSKILEDARVQYIMGEIDEAGYDAAVAQWYAQGGTQIAQEFTEAYQKSLNN